MVAISCLTALILPTLALAHASGRENVQPLETPSSTMPFDESKRMNIKRKTSYTKIDRRDNGNPINDPTVVNGKTFDYVIVGGGTTALTIANRLTEDNGVSVVVIEAGPSGDEDNDIRTKIQAPAAAYFAGVAYAGSPVDWSYSTVPQKALNNRQVFFPRGKLLGGSSAVNGLYMVRTSQLEQEAWANLVSDGNKYWNWNAMFANSKKSEFFHPPSQSRIDTAHMVVDHDAHGYNGPIHHSYPGFFYDQISTWIPTFRNLGVPTRDAFGGDPFGSFLVPSGIDPDAKYSRSYAKSGYLDPVASRPNLYVVINQHATKILLEGKTARGVQFKSSPTSSTYAVYARQEVVLSAGVIGSPQLLQLSGIGDRSLLSKYGIQVVKDLPGVGMQLTDHLSTQITFKTNARITGDFVEGNADNKQAQLQAWQNGDPNSLFNAPNDAIAYLNLSTVMGGPIQAFSLLAQMKAMEASHVIAYSSNPLIQSGYRKVYESEMQLFNTDVGAVEILMSNTGTYNAYPNTNTLVIQAALQHPLSHGSVKITSNNPFTAPAIDPQYVAIDEDLTILREGFKYIRNKLVKTEPLKSIIIEELSPGSAVKTDADWNNFIKTNGGTEYHPAGSCSMLDELDGGVVDANLRVHGIKRLRVADTSIIPMSLSAHLTVPAYAIGETAAQILKDSYHASPVPVSFSIAGTPTAIPTAAQPKKSHTSQCNGFFCKWPFNLPPISL